MFVMQHTYRCIFLGKAPSLKYSPLHTHPLYVYTITLTLFTDILAIYPISLTHKRTYVLHTLKHTYTLHAQKYILHTHKPTPTHRERNRETCVRSHYRLAQEMSANMGSMCTQDTINSATVTISVTIFDEI